MEEEVKTEEQPTEPVVTLIGETDEESVELTMDELRIKLQGTLFTTSVTVSSAEKRQQRQYEMNDYFMSHTLNLSAWNDMLQLIGPEEQSLARKEMFKTMRRRIEAICNQQKEHIHVQQHLDGIKTAAMDDEVRRAAIQTKEE